METKSGPPCSVCGEASAARNLCQTHYSRWRLHGHVEQTRPDDWGKRSNHPLYGSWSYMVRVPERRVAAWDDFWTFVAAVGERPTPKHMLARRDIRQPWGPDNAYWREPILKDAAVKQSSAEYQRAWRRKNPLRTKANDLKRSHGIGLDTYDAHLSAQGGGCAICGQKDDHYRLAVDHCHDTGMIRGLLCSLCNRGLGMFKDDPKRLTSALQYLAKRRGNALA